jgi:hypothetical protein
MGSLRDEGGCRASRREEVPDPSPEIVRSVWATGDEPLFSETPATAGSGFPHSGQNNASRSRMDAPHDAQRRKISGFMRLPIADSSTSGTPESFPRECSCYKGKKKVVKSAIDNRQSLDSVHRIEQIFALRIDSDTEFLALNAKALL